jgi:hypothetical protein
MQNWKKTAPSAEKSALTTETKAHSPQNHDEFPQPVSLRSPGWRCQW